MTLASAITTDVTTQVVGFQPFICMGELKTYSIVEAAGNEKAIESLRLRRVVLNDVDEFHESFPFH